MLCPHQNLEIYCFLKTGFVPSSVGFLHYDAPPLHDMDLSYYVALGRPIWANPLVVRSTSELAQGEKGQ